MHGELLILFVILLLGLILCSFLGVKEGMENAEVYYGPNGASAVIQVDSNGQNTLVVTTSDGTTTIYTSNGADKDVYVAPNGATATIIQTSNGSKAFQIKDSNGNEVLTLTKNTNTDTSTATTQNGTAISTNNYDNYNHYSGSSSPTIFYGPNGATAKIVETPNENTIVITNKNGTTEIYYIDANATDASVSKYYGPNGGSAKIVTKNGEKAVEITTPNGSKVVYTGENAYTYNSQDNTINQYDTDSHTIGTDVNATTYYGPHGGQATTVTGPAGNTYATYDSSAYYNSLPSGIPRSQIPPGEEDLYILKSQVVPPVCPRCPDVIQNDDKFDVNKCPPCPAPMRCSEPSFDCKKVPNYKAFNPDTMPVPIISDFSGFGM